MFCAKFVSLHFKQSTNQIFNKFRFCSRPIVSDDPISSTSEMDPSKSKSAEKPSSSDVDKGVNCFDTDVELFGMSISTERSEAIEENVDDLVNDLETLLGESTDDFNVPKKSPKSGEQSPCLFPLVLNNVCSFLI